MPSRPSSVAAAPGNALPNEQSAHDFNPDLADRAVAPQRLFFDRRFWQVLFISLRFFTRAVIDRYFTPSKIDQKQLSRLKAERIRELLIELGPTFIKVGQFLSTRRDLLPVEITAELAQLQDRVPPEAVATVRRTVEDSLGRRLEECLSAFEETPIASASIGQVHRARLKDGRTIVLKIQRPGLAAAFYKDLGYMRLWARAGGRMGWLEPEFWLKLSDEFGRTLFAEIDYLREGRNADRLRLALRNYPQVKVPRVYWHLTGRRLIALEYLPGVKIDRVDELKAMGLNLRSLGKLLIECYLEQVVSSGFFHADPHAGNLAVSPDGSLIMYDFGMVGQISSFERAALTAAIKAVCRRDSLALAKALVDLGVVRKGQYVESVARLVQPVIDYYFGSHILDLDFKSLEDELDALTSARAFAMPPSLAYLVRTGSSLEGLARTLRPNFSFAQAAGPFVRRLALEESLVSLQRGLGELAGRILVELPETITG